MKMVLCQNCGRTTGHKRAFGVGTILAVLISMGAWLIALPFYPPRCVICGATSKTAREISPWWAVAVIAIAMCAVIAVFSGHAAAFGTNHIRDGDGRIITECTRLGSISPVICREVSPAQPRLRKVVSGATAGHLIGKQTTTGRGEIGFSDPGVARVFAELGIRDQGLAEEFFRQLIAAEGILLPKDGTPVRVLDTADYYGSPLLGVKEMGSDRTYWITERRLGRRD